MLKIDLNIGRKQKRFDRLKGILTQKRKHNMASFEWGSHNDIMPQRNMSCLKHKPIFLHSATHKFVNKLYLLGRTQRRFTWGDPKRNRIFFKKKIYLHFVQKTLNPLQNTLHWKQYTCPVFFPTV